MPPFLQLVFLSPKMLKELLVVFIVQEDSCTPLNLSLDPGSAAN